MCTAGKNVSTRMLIPVFQYHSDKVEALVGQDFCLGTLECNKTSTTVTFSNTVTIESVSKRLGHTNIKTTQHYAKIPDKKVRDGMLGLRIKLENSEFN